MQKCYQAKARTAQAQTTERKPSQLQQESGIA
jgi:hypothetical protein